jgi:periplasmic protein TonB
VGKKKAPRAALPSKAKSGARAIPAGGAAMFENNLLESSPLCDSPLKAGDRGHAVLAGALGFIVGLGALPLITAPAPAGVHAVRAAILGAIAMGFAFMVIYVYREARHWGFKPWVWCGLVAISNLLGFALFLIYSAAKTGKWQRATIPIAYALEVCLVGALVLIPLLHTASLGKAELWKQVLLLPAPPPPPPAPGPARNTARRSPRPPTEVFTLTVPRAIPERIEMVRDDSFEVPNPELAIGVPGGMEGGAPGGIPFGIAITMAPPLPPPPVRAKATSPRMVRISHIDPARLIFQPTPEYPPVAKMARIQGTVRLEAVIGTDGRVENLKVISGHPLLLKAAADAVSRWRYQPTLLNGEPVEVLTEIDVIFQLAG